jgi:hypothetical protein
MAEQIKEDATILASMKFLGFATLVELDYEAPANARFTPLLRSI